jgi:hypothetical protein
MSISRYIVVAVARCSCACSRWPVRRESLAEVAVCREHAHIGRRPGGSRRSEKEARSRGHTGEHVRPLTPVISEIQRFGTPAPSDASPTGCCSRCRKT